SPSSSTFLFLTRPSAQTHQYTYLNTRILLYNKMLADELDHVNERLNLLRQLGDKLDREPLHSFAEYFYLSDEGKGRHIKGDKQLEWREQFGEAKGCHIIYGPDDKD